METLSENWTRIHPVTADTSNAALSISHSPGSQPETAPSCVSPPYLFTVTPQACSEAHLLGDSRFGPVGNANAHRKASQHVLSCTLDSCAMWLHLRLAGV